MPWKAPRGTNTFSGLVLINGATTTISADTGSTLNLTGAFSSNAYPVILTGGIGGTGTISSVIDDGSGTITKNNTGTWALTGNNIFSGAVAINNGTLSINTVATGTGAQSLGTGTASNQVTLGVASTSSGTLLYTGGAGTLDKNITAQGNGSDTIQNSGSGQLTLSGTLTKNGTKLTLNGGANGINVTGTIVGASANSDLLVTGGTTTISTAATYNGPTTIYGNGTLVKRRQRRAAGYEYGRRDCQYRPQPRFLHAGIVQLGQHL